MIRHYIIMSSSYSDGKRIAFDITDESLMNAETIKEIIAEIKRNCDDDVPLSVHSVITESALWESVGRYDPFFEDVICTESIDEFARKIRKDRELKGYDVAVYIASKQKCTHLELEKLVYLCYAEYLCSTAQRLFEDTIYAFKHGPVVKSVYDAFKKSGYSTISIDTADVRSDVGELPIRSRILFARDGVQKLHSIDSTLKKYSGLGAVELVGITHRDGSPWSKVDSSKMYQTIDDGLIAKYHGVEKV